MARSYTVHENPYSDAVESDITSKVLDVSDAFDLSISWNTTSTGTSNVTYQISNSVERDSADILEASWSNWTQFGRVPPSPPSASSTFFPPLGIRHIRFIRNLSFASITINVNKQGR